MLKKCVLMVVMLSPVVVACPANTTEWEGHCADMQPPQTDAPVKPSDELPPSHGGKRDVVNVDMPAPATTPETVSTLINGGVPER